MSTRKFADELTTLLTRWTRPWDINRDGEEILEPLTKRELVNTVKIVMQMKVGVYLHETTQAGIAASRPSSFAKSSRYRSLDDLLPSYDSDNVKSDNLLWSKSSYKKLISQSSPTIHISFSDRPDASIRAQAERGALHKQPGDTVKCRLLLNRVKVLRHCAADVIEQIDHLRKEIFPQTRIPRPRLPAITASPGPSGSSLLPRKILPSILRKSSSGTSTIKKLNPIFTTEEENVAAMRRAMARGSIFIKPLEMLPRSPLPAVAGSTSKKSTSTTAKTPKSAPTRSTMTKFPLYRKSFL